MRQQTPPSPAAARLSFALWLGVLCLVVLPGCEDQADPPVDREVGAGAITLSATVDDASAIAQPASNVPHPIAGRSPFPEAGESFTEPIPADRLSDLSQFRKPIDPADIPDIVPWDRASQYVGYDITVQGPIVGVGQSRDGKVNFLNFHQDWRGKFYMVIFDDLAKTLDDSVEALFKGKTVRVKGKVETHSGKPQMKITSMDQVEFVDG